ncbi:hypothetical protein CUJ84_Chr000217 [Rhizobium leguminosarum]|uniref:Uncharacterized protein n=1 Tax=Rhizobium leguminosarum TaxID=384 RepID=A0A2K9YXC6_RHILE|nr:hypothetical protein CUJ84_Chr000217 [Rhizobium leguminosarum]
MRGSHRRGPTAMATHLDDNSAPKNHSHPPPSVSAELKNIAFYLLRRHRTPPADRMMQASAQT